MSTGQTNTRRISSNAASYLVVSCLVLLVFASTSIGLNPEIELNQYRHHNWQTRDGLPQKTVFALAQDRDGYIWIGFDDGLVRFDALGFSLFEKRNESAFHDNRVRTLCAGKDGALWIGTINGGLIRRKNGSFKHYGAAEGLSGDRVKSIAEGSNGVVWIATDRGLNRFENNTITTVPWNRQEEILALHSAHDGVLWIGTSRGLSKIQPGNTPIDFDLSPGAVVGAIAEDPSDGTVWAGSNGSVYRIHGKSVKQFTASNGVPPGVITNLLVDSQGTLWIGSGQAGLSRYRNKVFEPYDAKNELSRTSIYTLLEDREKSLWTGGDSGLNRLRDTRVMMIDSEDGLENENTWGALVDSHNNTWIATDRGVAMAKNGQHHFVMDSRFPAAKTRVLMEDHSGSIWAGTETDGIFCASSRGARHIPVAFAVRSLRQDAAGLMWAGGSQGLLAAFSRSGTQTSLLNQNPWGDATVTDLAFDASGALLVATDGSGLWKSASGRRNSFGVQEGLASRTVNVLFVDDSGDVWIGTRGDGLYVLREGHINHIAPARGFPADTVLQIIPDRSGNLWIGTERGIFRAEMAALKGATATAGKTIDWLAFEHRDGMKIRSTAAGHPSSCSPDGFLWFPTPEGVAIINPLVLPTNTVAPEVKIDQVTADDLAFYSFSSLQFGAQVRRLEFQYTALSFIETHAIQYRYRLEGFDSRWFSVRDRRSVTYYNLPAGAYTFRILASNSDGVWNRAGAALSFTIAPPLAQAWWFRTLIGIGLGIALLLLHRLRLRRLLNRQRQLEHQLKQTEQDLRVIRRELARSEEKVSGTDRDKNRI